MASQSGQPVKTLWQTTQFTLVHVGTALTVVPVTSVLNRIMIADMRMSSILIAFLVTLPYWLSPIQVWIGGRTDRHVRRGGRRTVWILLGGLMAAVGGALTAPAAFLIPEQPIWGMAVTVATFLVWGFGINLASVSYLALLSGAQNREQRSRSVGLMWTFMILASIFTGLFLSQQLSAYTETTVMTSFALVAFVALLAVVIGSLGLETQAAADAGRTVETELRTAPADLFRTLWRNAVARRFFFYLLVILICVHAQDVLLEPYAADVLEMDVASTSRLVSIWGAGFFLTMLAAILLVRVWGEKRVAALGSWIAAVAFVLICATGLIRNANLFMGSVFLLGLGGGFMTQSNLAFMLHMTLPEARALYVGAWSVANSLGQALTVLPVALGHGMGSLTGSDWMGYASVFLLEAAGLLLALLWLRGLRYEEFQRRARELHDAP